MQSVARQLNSGTQSLFDTPCPCPLWGMMTLTLLPEGGHNSCEFWQCKCKVRSYGSVGFYGIIMGIYYLLLY